jgi:Protein of unknown function (DUF2510)
MILIAFAGATVTTPQAPAGWYVDPSGSPGQRWWTGLEWSTETRPAPELAASGTAASNWSYVGTPQNPTSATFGSSAYGYPPTLPPQNVAHAGPQNRYAMITFAIVALYLVIAFETHVVIFGILPFGMALRSQRRHEPLAPLAFAAAIIAVVVALARLT